MNMDIVRIANPQKSARRQFAFMLVFCPVFLGVSYFLMNQFGVGRTFQALFLLCGLLVSILAVLIQLKLLSSKGPQEWKLIGDRLVCDSPSSLLGRSFDVAWNDVIKVHNPGGEDFARCDLEDGSHVSFQIGERSGWEFFNLIKKLKKEQDAPSNGGNASV